MKYTCPCCGYRTFEAPPGSQARCPICGWVDDVNQLHFPAFAAQPNGVSLLEAQRNYNELNAKDPETIARVRFAGSGDVRDPEWRPLDEDVDAVLSVPNDFDGLPPPQDPTALYYWLPK